MNLKEFADKMSQRARDLPTQVNNIKKAKATTALKSLVNNTPQDTGRAVSNHVVTLGSPNELFIEAHSPGVKGSNLYANRDATMRAGRAVIRSARPNETICITNVTPYLRYHDLGRGAKAPTAITEMAVMAARNLKVSINSSGSELE